MARFTYTALTTDGELVNGRLSANSQDGARTRLRERGVLPLQVEVDGSDTGGVFNFQRLLRRKADPKALLLFTRELAVLLKAGVPLAKALAILDRLAARGAMSGVPGNLLAAVNGGDSLVAAMEKMPEIFPPHYTGMIRAGDEGGVYVTVLERLAVMLERSDALNTKIRNALAYPILVLIVTGLSLVVLMVFVIPEFRPVFETAGERLPLGTRVIMATSDFFIQHGKIFLIGLLVSTLAILRAGNSEAGRRLRDRMLLMAPLFGSVARKIETARFCRSLGTLKANGVTLVDAVGIAAGTLKNAVIADAARQVVAPLSRGEGLAEPMHQTGCFPVLATQLVRVGEESGHLEEMLLQVADVFDRETESSIQKLLALLSPTITIFLGLLIALIIGSILMAIMGTYDLAI